MTAANRPDGTITDGRLLPTPNIRDSFWFGLGLFVLAHTRPVDGDIRPIVRSSAHLVLYRPSKASFPAKTRPMLP